MDIEGNLVYINRRGLEILGLPEGEAYGKPWYFHVHPDDRKDAQGIGNRLIRTGGRARDLELRVLTASGGEKTISVLLNLTSIRDDSGHFVGVQGIAIDISGKKQAEIALQEAEERYRLITEGIADGVTLGDMSGIIFYASPSMTRITGYRSGGMVGHSFREFVVEKDREIIDACFEKTLLNGESFEGLRVRVKRKDGTCIYVEINGGPVIRDGKVIGAQSVTRDITRQVQVENALRESEERLNVTLHSIGDGVIVTGEDGRVTLINTVAESLTGWKEEEAIGMSLTDVFHIVNEKTLMPVKNPVKRVIEEGFVTDLANHTVLLARDGTRRAIADSAAPVRDKNGVIIGAVLVFRDVTAEKETEKVRRHLAAIIESSDDAIYGMTVEGVVTNWNQGAERIYGYPASEALGSHVSLFAPPDQNEEFMDVIRQITRSGRMDSFEAVRLRKDGARILLSITISPIMGDNGTIAGFSAISRDITRQKEAEHALNKSRQWLEHVVEGVRLGTWEWDARTRKVTFNRHLAVMLGYPQDCLEADGQAIGLLVSEADRVPVKEAVIATLKGLSPIFVQEVHLTGENGRTVLLQAWGIVMERDEDGHPTRLSGICQDISEIRGYQEALKNANKKLNLLNSITRHDLLNQTTALQGYMTLINRAAGEGDPVVRKYLGICSGLIDGIQRQVVFTRDYEDMGVNAPAWQHVGNAVRKAAADLSSGARKVSILSDTGDIEVYADPMFEKVLFNLFDNALRHGERVTEIRVSFRANGDGGVLTVEDNGGGIDPDSWSKIFLAGYGRNTGYGLFLAKEILDITGISISETGENGAGARFEMTVPERGYRVGKIGMPPAGS
nr:PAS domain S-box protein [Methanofollis ethanolicus]